MTGGISSQVAVDEVGLAALVADGERDAVDEFTVAKPIVGAGASMSPGAVRTAATAVSVSAIFLVLGSSSPVD